MGRVRKQHTALLRGLARELLLRGSIQTTVAKAKEVRPFVERLITLGKKESVARRRIVAARLGNAEDATSKLFEDIAPQYKERAGGYTRIIKLGKTQKRHTDEAKIELV